MLSKKQKIGESGFSIIEVVISIAVLSIGSLLVMNTTGFLEQTERKINSSRVETIALADIFRILESPAICSYTMDSRLNNYPGANTNLLPLLAYVGRGGAGGAAVEKIFEPGTDDAKFGAFGQSMELLSITVNKYHDPSPGTLPPPAGKPRLRLAELKLEYLKGGKNYELLYNILVYTEMMGSQEVTKKCWAGGNASASICQNTLGGIFTPDGCLGMTFNNIQVGHTKPTYGSNETISPSQASGGTIVQAQDRGSVFLMNQLKIGMDGGSIMDPSRKTAAAISPGRLLADKVQVNGAVTALNSSYAKNYYYLSDKRLKKDIKDLSPEQAKLLLKLNPIQYKLKTDPAGKLRFGFKAQEVKGIFPEAIISKYDYLMVDYGTLVAPLVKQVQGQEQEIIELEARLRKIRKTN